MPALSKIDSVPSYAIGLGVAVPVRPQPHQNYRVGRLQCRRRAGTIFLKRPRSGSAALSRSAPSLKAGRAYLARGIEDQDFFGSYLAGLRMVVGDAQPIIDGAEGERLQVAREVLGSHDIEKQQGWSAFCRTNLARFTIDL